MYEDWNLKITTVPLYRNLVSHLGAKLPNDIYLFRGERIVSINEALEKFFYLNDSLCLIKDNPFDTLVVNMNRLTPTKIGVCQSKLKDFIDDPKINRLIILDSLFKYEFKPEDPSDDKKKYYNPWTKLNYTCIENFKYKCRSLRIVSNSEQEFYHYLLSEFNTIEDMDETISNLISKKERINLDTLKAITLEELKLLKYFNEELGIGTNYKKLYDRMIPFVESLSKPKKVRKSISKGLKTDLWDKYYSGKLIAPCYVCKKDIDARSFEAGHVIPVAKGGNDTIDNLRPICRKCNGSMSDTELYEYKRRFYENKEENDISNWVDLGSSSQIEITQNITPSPSRVIIALDDKKSTTIKETKYLDKLFFHKLYRVRLKDINEDYKEWCKTSNISYSSKNLESMLSDKKCEKITDTFVYYSGVSITNKGMTELDRLSFIKLCISYKDTTKILRDLQRRNASPHDIPGILKIQEIPDIIRNELEKLYKN